MRTYREGTPYPVEPTPSNPYPVTAPGPIPPGGQTYQTPSGAAMINAGRLWSGGVAAGLVAAGVAVVGYLIVRGLLKIQILGARLDGAMVQPSMLSYAAIAFVAALVATGLLYVLLLTTPRPRTFFGWIVALVTIAAMLIPLSVDWTLEARIATALVNGAIGLSIGILVSISAAASLRTYPPR